MKNEINNKNCLIITGCISPVQQKYLVLTNTKERLDEYINSIKYYINYSSFNNIVFCDNSNYKYSFKNELYKLALKKKKRFEWISFRGNALKTRKQGKGYGEGEIINYVLKNSKLITSCQYFSKITGRLIITNINLILQNIDIEYGSIFMNMDIYRKNGIDTRFYIIRKEDYKKWYQYLYRITNDNIQPPLALEDVFYKETKKHKKEWSSLPLYPRFVGKSGGNGRDYTHESEKKLKFFDFLCKERIFNKFLFIYRKI